MSQKLLLIPENHPLNGINPVLLGKMMSAQENLADMEFSDAFELMSKAVDDLKLKLTVPASLRETKAGDFVDVPTKNLVAFCQELLRCNSLPEETIGRHSTSLLSRLQLLRAFSDPDEVIRFACEKVGKIIDDFPKSESDLRCGKNPGDVFDPYIFTATQILVYSGSFEESISASVAHKILMKIEGLMGHLHEDIIGLMRGNVRIPEPRSKNQETLDPMTNPFPGADLIQPPLENGRPLKVHQIKSKTGSAKGGDGLRVGQQLAKIQEIYGGEIYYDALIGSTLPSRACRARIGTCSTFSPLGPASAKANWAASRSAVSSSTASIRP